MDLSVHLQQKLEQKHMLTPQLKQSLDILKFSMQELEDYIRNEANGNPLIDIKNSNESVAMEMARLKALNESTISVSSRHQQTIDIFDQLYSKDESIELYLMEQLAIEKNLRKLEKDVITYYIRSLNNLGYLECDLHEVSARFQIPLHECEKLLAVFQSFEPVGIGARNLKECLLLQITRTDSVPNLAYVIVENDLEHIAERKFQLLTEKYRVTVEEIQSILSFIQTLQPYPNIEIEHSNVEYVIPDIIVEDCEGELIFSINDSAIPRITINSYYEELLHLNKEAKDFLKTKLLDALLLIKGIEQRHETLYKVTNVILQHQKEFFRKGKNELKPLGLKDIAKIVNLHESTVSRAISNKYIQVPDGVYPLKSLLMRGLKTNSGKLESAIYVKNRIKSIVENENPKKPTSDQKIANMLLNEGIQIARRTVAKYREEMGIMQSTKRIKR
nr:RNA polymerase factor sigma-54 [Lysinibacillus timonensis]